jgi:hypothetical protein
MAKGKAAFNKAYPGVTRWCIRRGGKTVGCHRTKAEARKAMSRLRKTSKRARLVRKRVHFI